MANQSILSAFERKWQHVISLLRNKADTNHSHATADITDLNNATIEKDGLMSLEDKTKLNNTNIAYGICATAAGTASKVVELSSDNGWALTEGSIIMVKFNSSNTASGVTLNVNGTGAYPIWYNNAEYTSNATAYTGYANRVTAYMFNGTHWVWISNSYDTNTTYTNVKLGHGYATCSTAEATIAKVATLSSYTLTTGGIVAVKFTNAVPSGSTLNINSKGAKAIYFQGRGIVEGIIKAGDIATFMYNGTQYVLISIDRWGQDTYDALTQLSVKAHVNHLHDTRYYQKTEIDAAHETINTAIAQKTQVQFITWEADD